MRTLAESLRLEGRSVVTTRQPGDCSIGPEVRRLLLEGQAVTAEAELFLYLADRAQNVAEVIRPALERGDVVLCDRFGDSTVVYQGHARGLDLDMLRRLNALATGGLQPDMTLLLDLPAEEGIARLRHKDRLDGEPAEFHRRVRDGFLAEAARDPDRWQIIDARAAPAAVAASCEQALRAKFERL